MVPISCAFGPSLSFVQETMRHVGKLILCLHLVTLVIHANYDSLLTTNAPRIHRETKHTLLFSDLIGFQGCCRDQSFVASPPSAPVPLLLVCMNPVRSAPQPVSKWNPKPCPVVTVKPPFCHLSLILSSS